MLEGKSIIVTGAGRGIGYAIATACIRAGAVVGMHYRDSGKEVFAFAEREPDRCVPLQFDVRDGEGIQSALTAFRERAGRLDGLVNNAGVNRPDLLMTATPERIREQLDVNLLGPILCVQAALGVFLEQRSGVILNISSVAAIRPARGQAVYAASKGGLESLTRALAVEYARKGIRVHGIRPGPVDTRMMESTAALAEAEVISRIPLGRLGRPEEIADLAVFLLSDRATFVTGSIHTIDGGYLEA
jgi:3-oxoacyl-[acyl-carrier protein] reductase